MKLPSDLHCGRDIKSHLHDFDNAVKLVKVA